MKIPSFACKDLNMDCQFSVKDKNMDKLMEKIASHAKSAHNIQTVPDDMLKKIQDAIKK